MIMMSMVLIMCSYGKQIFAFAATNFFRSHDYALRLPEVGKKKITIGLLNGEYGKSSTGENIHGREKNILQLRHDTQSALSMLANPVATKDEATNLAVKRLEGLFLSPNGLYAVAGGCTDAHPRGHIKMTGEFEGWDVTLFGKYTFLQGKGDDFPGKLSLAVHVPILHKKVNFNEKYEDQTLAVESGNGHAVPGDADWETRNRVTNELIKNVKTWGDLELANWDETGLGDVALMLEWEKTYDTATCDEKKAKGGLDYRKAGSKKKDKKSKFFDTATLYAKFGVLFPTGKEKDEDKAFSMPLGSDGAWGLPFGFGMCVNVWKWIKLGVDVDFLYLFDESRTRRLKTYANQTEFLMLNKGHASKEHGLTWQAHLYTQLFRPFKWFSLMAGYQYLYHGGDSLYTSNENFDHGVINSDKSLLDWHQHNIIFRANLDFFDQPDDSDWLFQMSAFYKLPLSGEHIIDVATFGGQFAVSFW